MVATFEQQQYINKDLLNTTCDKWKHRKCSGCGTASTPLWRRNLLGEIVCNACGLYLKTKLDKLNKGLVTKKSKSELLQSTMAQIQEHMKDKLSKPLSPISCDEENKVPYEKPLSPKVDMKCVNCSVTETPLWRRDLNGQSICNACGLYYKLHQTHRPLKNRIVRKRRRRIPDLQPIDTLNNLTAFNQSDVDLVDRSDSLKNLSALADLVLSKSFLSKPKSSISIASLLN